MPNIAITVPLINPNEIEAQITSIHVQDGQPISSGDLIASLETTKSTFELTAPQTGYIVGLRASSGDRVSAGDILCYLSEDPLWRPEVEATHSEREDAFEVPDGVRITQPALALARQHNLDLTQFTGARLITEKSIQAALMASKKADVPPPPGETIPNALIVFGGGGHGKSIIELVRAAGVYQVIGVVDDNLRQGDHILGAEVLGGAETLPGLITRGISMAANAVGGIGNLSSRIKVFNLLAEAGFAFPTLVHPTALVEPSATLAAGVQVMPHAYIGSQAVVGFGSLVNTGAIVSHDCTLGDYVNISPGAILAGEVTVGNGALVGMGVTVNLQVQVGAGARVGNGATIKADIPSQAVVRAGSVWPA